MHIWIIGKWEGTRKPNVQSLKTAERGRVVGGLGGGHVALWHVAVIVA